MQQGCGRFRLGITEKKRDLDMMKTKEGAFTSHKDFNANSKLNYEYYFWWYTLNHSPRYSSTNPKDKLSP